MKLNILVANRKENI